MKQVRFLLIVIVMAMIQLPVICKPKKLVYGDNIQYYGEVGKNKQPLGRGQLQLIGYAQYAIDITRGDFEGNKITNAEVFIGLSIWPNDPTDLEKRAAKYTGTMEFDIKEVNGRTYLVYKLIDGILKIEKFYDASCGYWYQELSITCKPQDNCVFERYASPQDSRNLDFKYHGNFHKDNGDIVYTYRFYLDQRNGGIKYQTDEKMSKAKEERLRAEEERKLATPGGLAEKIINMIDDKSQPFSEIDSLADKLLAMEKTDEQKQAVKRVIKECQLMGTGYNPDNDLYLSMSHKGTERGRLEMALAAKLQQQMIKGSNNHKTGNAHRCRLGQGIAHELYNKADYSVHHDRVFEDTRMGTITTYPRTWSVQKNKDGSYSYRDYTHNSGGNNGTYHEILSKEYLSKEITVSKSKIVVYWEERQIKPSDFYTSEETNDPMKIGNMKAPTDPFYDHKKGVVTYQSTISVGDKKISVMVNRNCTHQRIPLNRGTDTGMGYGIGVTTNSRGKTTATRDYFPDHLFKHQVRLTISLDEMSKNAGMEKLDLVVFLIENFNKLQDLQIVSSQECDGFVYCAYRAFAMEQY